jgi:peroxiredoxin/uncharacterized membrane protein YphA (DoxX/SURF4 family)
MNVALLLARVALSLTFLVAGIGKLADREGSRRAVEEFGIPAPLAPSLGILLPLAELLVVIALLPPVIAWWGAAGALLLLLLFCLGIAASLWRGKTPDCHCFGQLYSEPVGRGTLIRNGVLALVAVFVLVAGRSDAGLSPVAWLDHATEIGRVAAVSGLALLVLVAFLGWTIVRQLRAIQQRLSTLEERLAADSPDSVPASAAGAALGLPVHTPAPNFQLTGVDGETRTLEELRSQGRAVMLIFTDPNCRPCGELLPEAAQWREEHAHDIAIAVVSRGTPEENVEKIEGLNLSPVLLQQDFEVAESYEIDRTPSAVIVHPSGVVGSPVAVGTVAIRILLHRFLELLHDAPQPAVSSASSVDDNPGPRFIGPGEPAPDVELLTMTGGTVRLSDFSGSETVILFWDSASAECGRLNPDLVARREPLDARLLVVLSADSLQNQVIAFPAEVVIDRDARLARAFGVTEVPAAVRMDRQGRIVTDLAVGASAVRELLDPQRSYA